MPGGAQTARVEVGQTGPPDGEMNMIAMTRNLAAGVALLLLAACGAGNNSLPDAAAERAQYPEKPTLSIADGSLLGDRSAVRSSMCSRAEGA